MLKGGRFFDMGFFLCNNSPKDTGLKAEELE